MLKSSQKEFYPLEWFDGKLVRYGNIDTSHPSHFLYAVYDCFQDFRNLNIKDKNLYIEKHRKLIADNLDFGHWKRMVPIKRVFEKYVELFQENLNGQQVLSKVIANPNMFFNNANEEITHESHIESFVTNKFKKCLEQLQKVEKKTIQDEKKQKICDIFFDFHQHVLKNVFQSLFEIYKQRFADPLVPIDNLSMILLLYSLPVNVFFIDRDIQNIVTIDADYFIFAMDRKKIPNIFLLYSYPFSFESLGVVESSSEESPKHVKVRKLFSYSHSLVQAALKQT